MRIVPLCGSIVVCLAQSPLTTITGCDNGISCASVLANDLTFDCRFSGSDKSNNAGNVMMLHGFPEWSSMYMPLMREFGDSNNNYYTMACNLRGYSAGASPDLESDYNYSNFVSDVIELARVGFGEGEKYHLIGHDHGGILGWLVAASDTKNILSYSSLSSPHPDAFSDGLYGENADVQQVDASQYFTMFTLEDSATIHHNFWWLTAGKTSSTKFGEKFETPQDFQKSLWWYNGALADSIMAFPAVKSQWDLIKDGAWSAAFLRGIFGGTPDGGLPGLNRLGVVGVNSLFVCGTEDESILCSRDYSKKTSDFVGGEGVEYEYFEVKCGHDLLSCGNDEETNKVISKLIEHVEKNK